MKGVSRPREELLFFSLSHPSYMLLRRSSSGKTKPHSEGILDPVQIAQHVNIKTGPPQTFSRHWGKNLQKLCTPSLQRLLALLLQMDQWSSIGLLDLTSLFFFPITKKIKSKIFSKNLLFPPTDSHNTASRGSRRTPPSPPTGLIRAGIPLPAAGCLFYINLQLYRPFAVENQQAE